MKQEKVDDFNKILMEMFSFMDKHDLLEESCDISPASEKQVIKFLKQLDPKLLASRDESLLESLDYIKHLFCTEKFKKSSESIIQDMSTVLDIKNIITNTMNMESKTSKETIFEYIEKMFKSLVKKSEFNTYMNFKVKYEKLYEENSKKRANKNIKKIYPILKSIVDEIDKDKIKELFDILKNGKSGFESVQIILKDLFANEFDLEKTFEKYDIEI